MEEMTARAQELSEMAILLQNNVSNYKISKGKRINRSALRTRQNQNYAGKKNSQGRISNRSGAARHSNLRIPAKVNESLLRRGLDMNNNQVSV
jgi:hypothetical protein